MPGKELMVPLGTHHRGIVAAQRQIRRIQMPPVFLAKRPHLRTQNGIGRHAAGKDDRLIAAGFCGTLGMLAQFDATAY